MELKEHGHEEGNDAVDRVRNLDDNATNQQFLVLLSSRMVISV